MSAKDSVKRGAVAQILFDAYDNGEIDEGRLAYLISEVNKLSPVSKEMSAVELLRTEARMLQEDEYAYDDYSHLVWDAAWDDAVAFAEKWARKHPERNEDNVT